MQKKYPSSLKTVFLIHAIIAILVGLQHIFVPTLPGNLTGVKLPAPILYRILGAAVFAFGASSVMAYRAKRWENIRIIVLMEIIWSTVGGAIIGWGIRSGQLPTIEWPNSILLLVFGIVFAVYWYRK